MPHFQVQTDFLKLPLKAPNKGAGFERRRRRYYDLGPSATDEGPRTGDSPRSSLVAMETTGCSAKEELLELSGLEKSRSLWSTFRRRFTGGKR